MPSGLKRLQGSGDYHFVTYSCYRRQPYLNSDPARICFEERLEKLRRTHEWLVFGYVPMPEHVHLLVSEPKRYPLSTTLNVLKAETSKRAGGPFMPSHLGHEWGQMPLAHLFLARLRLLINCKELFRQHRSKQLLHLGQVNPLTRPRVIGSFECPIIWPSSLARSAEG